MSTPLMTDAVRFSELLQDADEREPYGYNAAQTIAQQIVDEVGLDGMREVLAAVDARTIAYVGDAAPEVVDTATDWRRFLDLVDEIGDASSANDLVEQYVVNPEQADLLAPRAEARDAYAGLADDGDAWAPPLGVRRRMGDWEFDAATRLMNEAQGVLQARDTLDRMATELTVGYPDTLEAAYESAEDDLSTVSDQIQAQTEATQRTLDAVAAEATDDGLFETIGFWGTDVATLLDDAKSALTTGDLDTANERAQQAIDTVEEASSVGLQRAALALGALVLVTTLIVGIALLTRRRRSIVPPDTPDTLDAPGTNDEDTDEDADEVTPE